MPFFIIMALWTVGDTIVLYLAGLQGIPTEYYEAVEMDGGGAATIRRECDLSDMILRVLIVRHEGPIKECVAPQELPPPDATRTGGFRRPRRY